MILQAHAAVIAEEGRANIETKTVFWDFKFESSVMNEYNAWAYDCKLEAAEAGNKAEEWFYENFEADLWYDEDESGKWADMMESHVKNCEYMDKMAVAVNAVRQDRGMAPYSMSG